MSTYSTERNKAEQSAHKNQYDGRMRVTAIPNLAAICERASSVSHYYWIEKVTRSRVHVGYSNPSEYGTANPMYAVYPVIPFANEPCAVLGSILNVIHDDWSGEGWQAFDVISDAQELFRSNADTQDWKTRYEILVARHPEFAVTSTWDKDGCVQTWHCQDQDFRSWRDAQDWAAHKMNDIETGSHLWTGETR